MIAQYPKAADTTDWIKDEVDPVTFYDANAQFTDVAEGEVAMLSASMYATLAEFTESEANDIVRSQNDRKGFGAYRQIARRFNLQTGNCQRGVLIQILNLPLIVQSMIVHEVL